MIIRFMWGSPRSTSACVIAALALLGAVPVPAVADPNQQPGYQRPGVTEWVSVASDGTGGNHLSWFSKISGDGRNVAFAGLASNLVPNDANDTIDVFVHDREAGTTERVSVASDGTEASGASQGAELTLDGRRVVFWSDASNLVDGDTNRSFDVFVHDRDTGITERVSVASDGTQGNGRSWDPVTRADGEVVAFLSRASNLVPGDTNGTQDAFVHDSATGITERVSVASDGTQSDSDSHLLSISANGRYVAFTSFASNLVPGDFNSARDVFVHDREAGTTERVSMASDGTEANNSSYRPSLSADGRHVTFYSYGSNLVPGDTNGVEDVFVHDRETGITERVSIGFDGTEANGPSHYAQISADALYVAFASDASNVAPGDTNGVTDIFVHHRETHTTERVSLSSFGVHEDDRSHYPRISSDGRYVTFTSYASNMVFGDNNGWQDVYVRDRGPATGVGGLEVQKAPGELMVSGWATYSGLRAASVEDPRDDGVGPAGAEIIGASVIWRPEQEDLLLDLDLASLPGLAINPSPIFTRGAAPEVLYVWSFTAEDSVYEVRALQAAATANPPTTDPYFALYECGLVCTETTRLSGGIGTMGAEVWISVPLEVLGVEEVSSSQPSRSPLRWARRRPGGWCRWIRWCSRMPPSLLLGWSSASLRRRSPRGSTTASRPIWLRAGSPGPWTSRLWRRAATGFGLGRVWALSAGRARWR